MTRDYTDYMNMTPAELAQHARDHAAGNDLVLALAHQLETEARQVDLLTIERDDAERSADAWRSKAHAVQRQLDQVRG